MTSDNTDNDKTQNKKHLLPYGSNRGFLSDNSNIPVCEFM